MSYVTKSFVNKTMRKLSMDDLNRDGRTDRADVLLVAAAVARMEARIDSPEPALATARDLGPEAQVVTILCDRAERYYSTKLFAN